MRKAIGLENVQRNIHKCQRSDVHRDNRHTAIDVPRVRTKSQAWGDCIDSWEAQGCTAALSEPACFDAIDRLSAVERAGCNDGWHRRQRHQFSAKLAAVGSILHPYACYSRQPGQNQKPSRATSAGRNDLPSKSPIRRPTRIRYLGMNILREPSH